MTPNIDNASDLQMPREGRMKVLTVSAVTLSVLGFASVAQAQQQGGRVFFEGDVIRGAQQGAPGPFCVLNNQFKRLEKVVFRFRIVDPEGKALDDKGIKSLFVELPSGQKLQAGYGQHPPRGEAADHFWTAAWIIPNEQPTGTFAYKATVTDLQGHTQTWEPFKIKSSQFSVVDGAITIQPPPAKK
jgi:hypothetical protein